MSPELPPAARLVDRLVLAAVAGAQAHDPAALDDALDRLARTDPAHVRRLLAALLRPLVEAAHPDGVDGDDLVDLVRQVVADSGWLSAPLSPVAVAIVLTGALGVHVDLPGQAGPGEAAAGGDHDGGPVDDHDRWVPPSAAEVDLAAVLVTARLAVAAQVRRALDAAWAEVARSDGYDD